MIVVDTIEDLHPTLRDRIKAKVMRRLIDHLRARPHVTDEAMRKIFGFDRAGLEELYASLSRAAEAPAAPAAALAPAQEPMLASLGEAANAAPAAARAPAPAARACCGGRSRD